MSEISQERKDLSIRILIRTGGRFAVATNATCPPILDEKFLLEHARVAEDIAEFRKGILADLKSLDDRALMEAFSPDGKARIDHWINWQDGKARELGRRIEALRGWDLAALGIQDYCPNESYWSNAAYLTVEEATWLSLGLEPVTDYARYADQFAKLSTREQRVLEVVARRRVLVRRRFNGVIRPGELHRWLTTGTLEVHESFRRIVEGMVAALGSRLIDFQSQKSTVAARAMAERNTFGHLS